VKSYYVYILKCSDDSYYIGITNDVERRFVEHNEGHNRNSYTYNRRPIELMFVEAFNDSNQAIDWEKKIKGWSRKKKEALILRNWDKLKDLAICRNDTNSRFFDSAQNDTNN